ncbi:hypothetical protein ACHAWU_001156 [Discostella pseudostelligera]|uniref:Uncharacterized protein n=1 Tax=Discostella pseudostelligera TaxID=259834 RepID=A0ABD3MG51_9STRA
MDTMAASRSSSTASSMPKVSQEDDDKLFLATGFRYLPAHERGFPYPWCAKKSRKGWIVRSSPPSLVRHLPDIGVEFVGWREAEKMFRSREILMERVKNMERLPNGHNNLLNGTSGQSGTINSGPCNMQHIAVNKVHEWFHSTQRVVQGRQMQASEEEFQSALNKQKKKYRSELKEELREKKRREIERKEAEALQSIPPSDESPSDSLDTLPDAHPPLMSPTRKKYKKMPPKPIQQLRNSVVLGEDPELDQMIEDVVFDFMHEFSKGQDGQSDGNARSSVECFDGSAISVLREAAKDTLHSIANQEVNELDGNSIGTKGDADVEFSVTKNPSRTRDEMRALNVDKSDYQLHDDADGTDERISAMIEQLIGEAQQDSDCQFDQRALDALKEAAKEIVAMEMDDVLPV